MTFRYMQRFDPGFGFSAGPYTVQPMYTPAINYNTEFPQLGSSHRPQVSVEPPRPLPQPMPGPWTPPSNPATLGYGHPDNMVTAFSPSHINVHSTTAIYLHSTQYPCQRPGMPFVHPHEHQTFLQVHLFLFFGSSLFSAFLGWGVGWEKRSMSISSKVGTLRNFN